jgi:hypothetical protein
MTPDMINGLFECVGGLLVLLHCRAVLRDRAVAGVSPIATALFTLWGIWNLFYYPHLGQWFSFAAGLVIVAANGWWLFLLYRFRSRP